MNTQQTYISEKIKNENGEYINPATEEWQSSIVNAINNISIPTPEGWATSEKQDMIIALSEMSIILRSILTALTIPRNADTTNNADRVTVVNTVNTAVSTITTLTNLQQLNGVQSHQMSVASEINAWYDGCRSRIQ